MSTNEMEELQEILGELAQMWPQLIVISIAIALFVLLIVFSIKFIRHRYGKAKEENQKFGQRALRVTGHLVSTETKSHTVKTGHKDTNDHNIYKTEYYTLVTYGYCVDGVEYKFTYETPDTLGAEYDSQHEFLFEQGRPKKVYWSEDAYKPTGKSVGCGCYICVLVAFLVILLLGIVLRLFGLE